DAAIETLFVPFRDGRLPWPRDGAWFLRARAGALHPREWPGLRCVQSFRPDADALQAAGFAVSPALPGDARAPLVLLLPPRQREEARALLAQALDVLVPGGRIVLAARNDEGARSHEADLARLAGAVTVESKHKCRVAWSAPLAAPADPALAAQWRALDAPRPVADGTLLSRPGVFAWDRIDPGSALLAAHLPADAVGDAADLGAGCGVLARALLARAPGVRRLDLYEAEARALELAEHNLAAHRERVELGFHWHDVATGLPCRYDLIVCNPPFHAHGRDERVDLGRRFIEVAAQALRPRGRLWLVANRHLPYEAALAAGFAQVRTVAQADGYKVVEAVRG
ncbi:MAG TPA: class I SAM-dependent methyltransferase, partial [Lysobacter sp.]|nr:class I SAM-dependent methyltransferase [Lysobacter sp.]